jgi:hypothetical protein
LTAANTPLVESQRQVESLYKQVVAGDGAPTAAQAGAAEAVHRELVPRLNTWNQLQNELPGLNKRLRGAKLAPISPGLPAPRDLNVADEE